MEAHQEGRRMEEMKHHIKGKRTKRRRPSSALTLTLASTSSSSSTTGSENVDLVNNSSFFQKLVSTKTTNILQNNHTNNDQDIANCLMLLSHGQRVPTPLPSNKVVSLQSYVYECKTCDRGFASSQALGGHKASHNKPRKAVVLELSKNRTSLLVSPSRALLSCNPSGSTKGSKVHECSICGSDFTSGQALGGHMRRHRSMTMAATTTTTANYTSEYKKHKALLVLPLDLNLIEDDNKETENAFQANNQIIVFSTPSLVDSHF